MTADRMGRVRKLTRQHLRGVYFYRHTEAELADLVRYFRQFAVNLERGRQGAKLLPGTRPTKSVRVQTDDGCPIRTWSSEFNSIKRCVDQDMEMVYGNDHDPEPMVPASEAAELARYFRNLASDLDDPEKVRRERERVLAELTAPNE